MTDIENHMVIEQPEPPEDPGYLDRFRSNLHKLAVESIKEMDDNFLDAITEDEKVRQVLINMLDQDNELISALLRYIKSCPELRIEAEIRAKHGHMV